VIGKDLKLFLVYEKKIAAVNTDSKISPILCIKFICQLRKAGVTKSFKEENIYNFLHSDTSADKAIQNM
jgi:hypothetical protein